MEGQSREGRSKTKMTFQKKPIRCPYKTSNRKCVHKGSEIKQMKRKRVCGYGNQEDCELYCEWAEIVNACYRASHTPSEINVTESDND